MKRLLFFITIFIALTAQGQNEKASQKKIQIGVNFSPDYSFRTLKNNDGSPSSDFVIKSRNDIEIAKIGYTTGLNVCFNFSQLVGLETGIQFSNKGYKTNNRDLVYFPPNPNLPSKAKTNYTYQYIGIPLKAKFSFGEERIRFLTSIGFMTNFLLNVKQTNNYEYSDGKTEKKTLSSKSDYKNIDISPMISAGIDYKLNSKIHLLVEPTFRYGLLNTREAPVTENLWSAGLNFGIYHTLK